MNIIFMGTPDFAVPSLAILVENGYNVVGVITAVDKPAGRGKKLKQSAVKQYALSQDLTVLQPKNLKHPNFIAELAALKADLQVVVAFRMLPAVVFEMPQFGTFNLHGSLLPNYRGAAPIHWAIINGEEETGVTTFFIEQKIDTGNILFQEKIAISYDMTTGDLHDKMMHIGAALVLSTTQKIEQQSYVLYEQPNEGDFKPAPKIFPAHCNINWHLPSGEVYNLIRGMNPFPGAFTKIDGKRFKIYKAVELAPTEVPKHLLPGEILIVKNKLFIGALDGILEITEVQMEGKRKMDVAGLLNGYKIVSLEVNENNSSINL